MTNTPQAVLSAVLKAQQEMLERNKKYARDLPTSVKDWPPKWRQAYEAIAKDMQDMDRIPEHMAKKDAEDYVRLVIGLEQVKQWRKETR